MSLHDSFLPRFAQAVRNLAARALLAVAALAVASISAIAPAQTSDVATPAASRIVPQLMRYSGVAANRSGAIAPPLEDFGAVIRAEGASGVCGISTAGEVSCTGGVKVLANTQGASHLVETYSVQSTESWMEDFGSGSLENGRASIPIDPTFADAANTAVEYHVFLTPDGDCKGLYIANKTATGFEVHELGGGSSSIAFEYRIVAKRKGHEGERPTDVTERFNREKEAASHAPTPPVEASTPKRPGTPWATQRAPTGQERK